MGACSGPKDGRKYWTKIWEPLESLGYIRNIRNIRFSDRISKGYNKI